MKIQNFSDKSVGHYEKIFSRVFHYVKHFDSRLSTRPLILCYHGVNNLDWYSVTYEMFIRHISFLKNSKKLVSLSQILSSSELLNSQVSITFDDGDESVYKMVFPYFKKNKLSATVFIIGNKVNTPGYLSKMQLNELHDNGWEIGFHTENHVNLSNQDQSTCTSEIIKGTVRIKEKYGFNCKYFAYPYGKYSKNAINALMQSGYISAFTTTGYPIINSKTSKFLIPRLLVGGNIDDDALNGLLSPTGLFINQMLLKLVNVKSNIFT